MKQTVKRIFERAKFYSIPKTIAEKHEHNAECVKIHCEEKQFHNYIF
ncbi:hypothetical protein WwAna0131 [Wolbachia endosymbiont of Drosophila ananassae]|nr:hypothetical protein WwAna0131 [Wolbachia endosymbiont of Drosophila ananassae]